VRRCLWALVSWCTREDGLVTDECIFAETTHLILARTTTPEYVPGLLRRIIPTLTFGLVVLDLSCVCPLTRDDSH
jgi:hypothetical protein